MAKVRRGVDQEEQKRGEIRRRGKELIYIRFFFFLRMGGGVCERERNRGIDWGRRVREKEIEELIEEFIRVDV